jgi:hypothetical protein
MWLVLFVGIINFALGFAAAVWYCHGTQGGALFLKKS